ncbi:MAG: YcjF family protein [Alphaproteobacteria bacterium]|nr:YcjF family protein [Alphaproteobacteria bacterium]
MSEHSQARRPVTFRLSDPGVIVSETDASPLLSHATVRITPEPDPATLPVPLPVPPRPPALSWGVLFWGGVAGLVLLGTGLGVVNLINDLFAHSRSLGFLGVGLAALTAAALGAIVSREAFALMRLAAIEKLRERATAVLASDSHAESRAVVQDLLKLSRHNPQLARPRAALSHHSSEIIDGADLIRLAERELMGPLDAQAQRLVSTAAQQVSIVTAISPRALIDVLFVFVAAIRLIRRLSRLYGGRPGAFGLVRLVRMVIAHLAITGGVAASDSLVQQMLGQGIAARLSHRLGEGVLNGLLTARLGLAAIDVTRPLPFAALPQPALVDLARNLLRKKEKKE